VNKQLIKENGSNELKEERRKDSKPLKMRSKKIEPEIEEQLLEVTGLTRAGLYNRRGGLSERGLAPLLETTDEIVDIKKDHVVIRTSDGSLQTFWNMKLDLPFIWSVPDCNKDCN